MHYAAYACFRHSRPQSCLVFGLTTFASLLFDIGMHGLSISRRRGKGCQFPYDRDGITVSSLPPSAGHACMLIPVFAMSKLAAPAVAFLGTPGMSMQPSCPCGGHPHGIHLYAFTRVHAFVCTYAYKRLLCGTARPQFFMSTNVLTYVPAGHTTSTAAFCLSCQCCFIGRMCTPSWHRGR